jgi:hypothetical protein
VHFMHKFSSDDSLEQYKVHWVLRGFSQQPGVDYDETFSAVVKLVMVYTVLSLPISCCWSIYQLDVKNVLLYGTHSKTV